MKPVSALLLVAVALFAQEAHVSGGYEDCFADVGATICVMSDVRKAFTDARQANEWIASRQQQAERQLFTAIPAVRTALAQAARNGVPIVAVDDWRLPQTASFSTEAPPTTGLRRVHLDVGNVGRDLVSITFTASRAPTSAEQQKLVELVQQAFKTPAYDPQREREGMYAPSLQLFVAAEHDDDDGPSLPPPKPTKTTAPRPPLTVEDVRAWQPLFISEGDDVDIPLGIGTTMRISPAARATWQPWFKQQLTALRKAWSSTSSSSLPKRVKSIAKRDSTFHDVDGFRPWGPLSLGDDIQARIDDGAIVRMARTRAATSSAAAALYGPLTEQLRAATTTAPLPAPPSSSSSSK